MQPDRLEQRLALACIALFAGAQAWLVLRLNVNWDEFLFLAQVFNYQAGRLPSPFQTFHVHLFGWLAALPLGEIDRIIAGRAVMFALQLGTAACVWRIARDLAGPRHAAIAALAWLAGGYALGQGASFRADPLAALLLMASLACLLERSWWRAVLAGVLAATALLVTIKSALYLPAFAAVALIGWRRGDERRGLARDFAIAALVAGLLYAIGMAWHEALAGPPQFGNGLKGSAANALGKTVLSQALFPRAAYIVQWAMLGTASAVLILAALGQSVSGALRQRSLAALVPLLLVSPLLVLVVYRNAYAYFFPFITAPAAPVVALVVSRIGARRIRLALIGLLLIGMVLQFLRLAPREQSAQRAIVAAAQTTFPRPVSYIDRSSMLPSWPKYGPFLSSWGLEVAQAKGTAGYADIIARHAPLMVIANSPAIEKAFDPAMPYDGLRLPPADEAALRDNYVRHWGPVWVAGKRLSAGPFTLTIGGRYRLECKGDGVGLDGVRHPCGTVLNLAPGAHTAEGATPATLRWAKARPASAATPPDLPIFYMF